jgi:SRSO17 transposase
MPERSGVVILDATSFPKQGMHSVGVARQYCGTFGKVANCQVAVTAALWTGVRAWMLGAALYVPESWLTVEARQRAKIPATVRFQEKGRLALTLLRQIRAAGFQVTAVVGDADFGDNAMLRRALHRWNLPYALGISSTLTVFRDRSPRRRGPCP